MAQPRDAAQANRSGYLMRARRRHPGRILLMALALTTAVTAALGAASDLFDDLSGGRYAEEIIVAAVSHG